MMYYDDNGEYIGEHYLDKFPFGGDYNDDYDDYDDYDDEDNDDDNEDEDVDEDDYDYYKNKYGDPESNESDESDYIEQFPIFKVLLKHLFSSAFKVYWGYGYNPADLV